MDRRTALRSAIAFFLVTFSTAFLATIGARLTGWFTKPMDFTQIDAESLGATIMAGVIVLAVGAGAIASGSTVAMIFGFLALTLASVNIFGGFLVTGRMLAMYKKKGK